MLARIVCFRSGSLADEWLALPLFVPFIQQEEIANLPAYSYYARIAAVEAQEPMSGVTVVVDDKGSDMVAERVIASSRSLYAKQAVEQVSVQPSPAPDIKSTSEHKSGKSHLTDKTRDKLSEVVSVK